MKEFNPKEKSKGLGDTIAKFTNVTGIDKLAAVPIKQLAGDKNKKDKEDTKKFA